MASGSTPPTNLIFVSEDTTHLSRSYFQKTICLEDWWLIKPERDDGKNAIGVAGISHEQKVMRHFSSAPILKIYDPFELETIDGVCVVLQGLINKTRTLENGFSSEVFNHFVFGFPRHWETFVESCLRSGSDAVGVSREGRKGSHEGHQEVHDKIHGKSRHLDSDTIHMGVQDSEDAVAGNVQAARPDTDHNESVFEVPQGPEINVKPEVLCPRSPLPEVEAIPCLMVGPISRDVHNVNHDVGGNSSPAKASNLVAANSSTKSNHLKVSGRPITRSMKKNLDTQNSKNISLSQSVGFVNGATSCSEGRVLRSKSKQKQNDQHIVEISEDQRKKLCSSPVGSFGQAKNKDADASSESGRGLEERKLLNLFDAECPELMDPSSTKTLDVGYPEDASAENLKFAPSVIDSTEDEVLVRTSMTAENLNFAPPVIDSTEDEVPARTSKKANGNKERKITAERKWTYQHTQRNIAKRQPIACLKACTDANAYKKRNKAADNLEKFYADASRTSNKSERKFYGSEGKNAIVDDLSADTFSSKRSRSGRLLLPILEFWRNQRVVYDKAGKISAVKGPT